jgi:hypothetical protein
MVGIVVRYMLIASMLFRDEKEENMRFSQSIKAELQAQLMTEDKSKKLSS